MLPRLKPHQSSFITHHPKHHPPKLDATLLHLLFFVRIKDVYPLIVFGKADAVRSTTYMRSSPVIRFTFVVNRVYQDVHCL